MPVSLLHPAAAFPALDLPRRYNAATWFIDRHVAEGRGRKVAYVDPGGGHTYADLAERVNRAGQALLSLGLDMEQRVALLLPDTVQFPSVFWGAIKAGIVPIPFNTLLTTEDYEHLLADSRARALVVSACLLEKVAPVLGRLPFLRAVVVSGGEPGPHASLERLMAQAPAHLEAAPTTADDIAFWLYSSGSTGAPKGAMHLHRHLVATAELYGRGVLGLTEADTVYSAAKLFFAYGLGNGMSFPLHVGATTILLPERPTPDAVMGVLQTHKPTVFCGVPTLLGAILAEPKHAGVRLNLRMTISAGEALPEEIGRRWQDRFGVEVVDGLGSTELLHIFLSNRPGKVRYGTSGVPVPGYEVRIVDEAGRDVPPGEVGELVVHGPSAAQGYWNRREQSLKTFKGEWTHTGDKYSVTPDGLYLYHGRADDMLKVGGIWVSPFEVESALLAHPAVQEAAVVAQADEGGLIKPKAYIVPASGVGSGPALEAELKAFVKERLAPYKYPRWITFVTTLPKTATGKIQRFRLRVG
ncbi:MAG TPA: benzoate-CoA ligase family protein [Magnetospirillum sp.]|jgi:4-hydroxybenzoate-CoA ligase/benzoate-CoA ligase|nr:benzoate-CoA ligase family protein [Magnetospirillum sp.]